MIWIVIGVASLIFFAIAYKCAQTWEITHVVLATLVFLSSLGFILLSAMTLKTLDASRSNYDSVSADLVSAEENNQLLSKGTFEETLADEKTQLESVRALRARLNRVLAGRGRVWSGCTSVAVDGQTIQLNVLPVAAAPAEAADDFVDDNGEADEPVVAPKHHIGVKTTLYAFKEADAVNAGAEEAADGGMDFDDEQRPQPTNLPSYYLGAYQVTQADDTTVTLSPISPISESQRAQRQDGTWTLFETLPVDDHGVFAILSEGEMTEEDLRTHLPQNQFAADKYADLLQQYLRDGGQADPQNDPAERVWKRVEFLKTHTIEVDSQQTSRFVQDPEDFDPSGLAISPSLKQGVASVFEEGSTHLFDSATADKLIASGVCKGEVELVFVRQLKDYGSLLPAAQQNITRLNSEISQIERESTADDSVINLAILSSETQYEAAEKEKSLLDEDLQHFSGERAALAKHLAIMQQRWKDAKAEMSKYYRENNELAAQWAQIQKATADQINAPAPGSASNRKSIELSRSR